MSANSVTAARLCASFVAICALLPGATSTAQDVATSDTHVEKSRPSEQAPENWYRPIPVDATLVPPAPPAPPRKSSALSIQMPLYQFVAGELSGGAAAVRLRFDADFIGLYAGLYTPGGWLDVGLDFNFLGGSKLKDLGGGAQLWILYPTFGTHVMTSFEDLVLGIPITLTGLRMTTCEPACFVVDLHGPLVEMMFAPSSLDSYYGFAPAFAVGASLTTGIAF